MEHGPPTGKPTAFLRALVLSNAVFILYLRTKKEKGQPERL